jgi:hypothetical protein
MRYLIIMTIFMLSACTNHTRDPQNTRSAENPNLYTIGYIGNVKVVVGFADQTEIK